MENEVFPFMFKSESWTEGRANSVTSSVDIPVYIKDLLTYTQTYAAAALMGYTYFV